MYVKYYWLLISHYSGGFAIATIDPSTGAAIEIRFRSVLRCEEPGSSPGRAVGESSYFLVYDYCSLLHSLQSNSVKKRIPIIIANLVIDDDEITLIRQQFAMLIAQLTNLNGYIEIGIYCHIG